MINATHMHRKILIVLIVITLTISTMLLVSCNGNKYYYNELFLHIKSNAPKQGESYRITENINGDDGNNMTFELYVNSGLSHFIAISVLDPTHARSLQLSLDTNLSGTYSLIPKLKDDNGNEQYTMCTYNNITGVLLEQSSEYCVEKYHDRVMDVAHNLLPILLAHFEQYITTHSSEMHDITWAKLGMAEMQVVDNNATNDSVA